MANEVRIRATADTRDADAKLGGLSRAWKQFQESGSKGGFAIGASAAVAAKGLDLIGGAAFGAGRAVGDFIGDSIKAASDLNESMSKSSVIFGSASKDVETFAATADRSLGLSKQAALEAAASFGNLFLGTGQTAAEAAKLSKSMVGLAGDLASFNNLDPTETLQKLRSGLTGEAEPLRAVGVFLTEAKVKAKAMELGLADAHGELSEGAKVMARYQLILDETKTAQGDFARTADGLANSQRVLNAELVNLQANLGERFLPIAKGVTGVQLDLVTGFGAFADMLSGKLTPEVLALNKALGVSADSYNFTADNLASMSSEAIDAAVALGALTQEQGDAAKNARELGGKINSLADRFPTAKTAADGLGGAIAGIGTKSKDAARKVGSAMGSIVDDIVSARSGVTSAASGLADAMFDPLIAKGELAATELEAAELRRVLKTGKLRGKELADAKRRMLELRKTQIEQMAALAGYGDESAAATLQHQLDVLASTKNLSTEQRAEIKLLRDALARLKSSYDGARGAANRLANVRFENRIGGGGRLTAREHGGPVSAGEPYIVGEKQAELFVPSTSGYILPSVPSGGGASGGSGGIVVQIPTTIMGMPSPGQVQQWARDAAPALARELQRQGLIR